MTKQKTIRKTVKAAASIPAASCEACSAECGTTDAAEKNASVQEAAGAEKKVKAEKSAAAKAKETTKDAPGKGFRWHFHSKSVNETAEALEAAEANGAPVLLFVSKPGCAVCESAWSSIDAEDRLASCLKAAGVVGLKVDDSYAHYMALASSVASRKNPDGSRPSTTAPFMVLVRVKGSGTSFGAANVASFMGGTGGRSMPKWTYENAVAWLTSALTQGGRE